MGWTVLAVLTVFRGVFGGWTVLTVLRGVGLGSVLRVLKSFEGCFDS